MIDEEREGSGLEPGLREEGGPENERREETTVFHTENFLVCIGVYPINNAVIVSGEQQRDSATHTHESILPHTPLPSETTYFGLKMTLEAE